MRFAVDSTGLNTALAQDARVVIQFWAEWCAPCRAMIPVVDAFADERGDSIRIARVDIDANPDLAAAYRVTAVPMFVVAENGAPVDAFTGAMPQPAFAARVDRALAA